MPACVARIAQGAGEGTNLARWRVGHHLEPAPAGRGRGGGESRKVAARRQGLAALSGFGGLLRPLAGRAAAAASSPLRACVSVSP